jgi:hypothetical protein
VQLAVETATRSCNTFRSAFCAERMVGVLFANSNDNHVADNEVEEHPLSVFPYQDTAENKSWAGTLPLKQGLYDPSLEKDACGVGFAAYVDEQNLKFRSKC